MPDGDESEFAAAQQREQGDVAKGVERAGALDFRRHRHQPFDQPPFRAAEVGSIGVEADRHGGGFCAVRDCVVLCFWAAKDGSDRQISWAESGSWTLAEEIE